MEFLLSWLNDYVDLVGTVPFEPRAEGERRSFAGPAALRLGERLTRIGFAVEAYPIARVGPGELEEQQKIDVEVTSNRPDAMCHLGLARELAVALETPLRAPAIPSYPSHSADGSGGAVRLEDPEACPRFVARRIRGVRIGPSPEWLRQRLEAIGVRSINNVVDATNYVLWELGQPLHPYDLARIPGGELCVRRARAGERLVTLDGRERTLDPEILVIADRERAVGLAGIMGGLDTEVTETTSEVLLESAHFDRRRIRIGARRLGLHTDASHRFERGADFGICDLASRRCAALIVELAGGEVVDAAVDAVARRPQMPEWSLDGEALERFAGVGIGDDEIERILRGLGFAPRSSGARQWRGPVPSWREVDFEPRRAGDAKGRETYAQDLFEEVLRHVGLDRIPSTLPRLGGVDAGRNPEHDRRDRVRRFLAGVGFSETIHFAFHDAGWDAAVPGLGAAGEPLRLANPLSERYAVMRRSLVPNLVATAEFNANRGAEGVRLCELGHLFPGGNRPEIEAVALLAGGRPGGAWDRQPEVDLLGLLGVCEALFSELGAAPPQVRPATLPGVVEGCGGRWHAEDGDELGWFGRLSPSEAGFPLFAAEIRLDRLPLGSGDREVVPPPRLPGIRADLTLTHPREVRWREIEAAIVARPDDLRVGFELKDRYQGSGIAQGAVATTITFHYNGGERSLTQEEVNERHLALAGELERRFGLPPRKGEG